MTLSCKQTPVVVSCELWLKSEHLDLIVTETKLQLTDAVSEAEMKTDYKTLIMTRIDDSKVKWAYSSLQAGLPSPLRELTYHMGSHSVTCHPAEVTFPPLPRPKLVLDLATPEGCKAELT